MPKAKKRTWKPTHLNKRIVSFKNSLDPAKQGPPEKANGTKNPGFFRAALGYCIERGAYDEFIKTTAAVKVADTDANFPK